jgi:hypothetical protein
LLNLKNFNIDSGAFVNNYNFKNNFVISDSIGLLGSFLKTNKNNFIESGKTQFFKNDFLFVNLSEDKVFKQNIFRKNQTLNERKKTPVLTNTNYLNTKL